VIISGMYEGASSGKMAGNKEISTSQVEGWKIRCLRSVSGCKPKRLFEPDLMAIGLAFGAGQQTTGFAVVGESRIFEPAGYSYQPANGKRAREKPSLENWGSRGTLPLAATYVHFGEIEAPK